MISREKFALINDEVKKGIEEAFNYLKSNNCNNNYILFLAEGEYKKELQNNHLNLNPYVIDNYTDKRKDSTRFRFLIDILSAFYSFPETQFAVDDNEQRIHIELMVYTHVWESTAFLRKLFRFATLIKGEEYPWVVEVPDMAKHDFIRSKIRDIFKNKQLKIAEVITKGFHSSLRNAFAHSEYVFEMEDRKIILDNYNGAFWELKEVTFDDWSERFVYSALFAYHVLAYSTKYRKSLPTDFNSCLFLIKHPSPDGAQVEDRYIEYREDREAFNFIQH